MSLIQMLADCVRRVGRSVLPNQRMLYLDSEIPKLQEALSATPAGHPDRVNNLSKLGGLMGERYSYSNDMADSEAAVSMMKEAADLYPTGHPEKATLLNLVTLLLVNRNYETGDTEDARYQIAMDITREALDETSTTHPDRDVALKKFVMLRVLRYNKTRKMIDIDEALRALKHVIDIVPPSSPLWPGFAIMLDSVSNERYSLTGNATDLDASISMFQDAVDRTPEGHPDRLKWLNILSVRISNKFSRTGDMALLEETIRISQEAVDLCKAGDEADRLVFLNNLGLRLGDRHSRTGATADLEEAINILHQVVDQTPMGHPDRPMRLGNLGLQLGSRWALKRDKTDLEESIRLTREALQAIPPGSLVEKAKLSNNLGIRLGDMYSVTQAPHDLEESIRRLQDAVKTVPKEYFDRANWLINLGQRLHDKYISMGNTVDLEEAIRVINEAKELAPENHPSQAKIASHLGIYLMERYISTGDMEDLEKSIYETRKAIDATPIDHPERPAWLNNLGLQLNDRYSRTGAMRDLEEAIHRTRQAIEVTPPLHADRASRLSNLGLWLSSRYARIGAMADLDEAIRLTREAIELTPKGHREMPAYLNNLGIRLSDRHQRTREREDLDEAIRKTREAISATPEDHPNLTKWMNNLGSRLGDRYVYDQKREDIEEAYNVLQKAIAATPSGHPFRASLLNNTGNILGLKYLGSNDETDIQEAISAFRESVDVTPKDHPGRAQRLINLGHYLSLRYKRTEQAADLDQARNCLAEALYSSTSDFHTQVAAGQNFLLTHDVLNDHRTYDIAETTVGLIPLLTPRSLENTDKRQVLSRAVGTASDAAAIALHFNKGPLAAINCLETGRTVIAGNILQQHDISRLEEAHSDLATTFKCLRDQLDTPYSSDSEAAGLLSVEKPETTADRRREAYRKLDHILQEIQSTKGFERFLLPASEADMLDAARTGPIVILNGSKYRCDALIVQQSGIRVLELPHISLELIDTYLVNEDEQDSEDDSGPLDKLEWLWDNIVYPVLNEIGLTNPSPGYQLPNVWWIPTGKFTKVPLHAAGHHLRDGIHTALDMVVSSYASSIKIIMHGRQKRSRIPAEVDLSRLVTVAMKDTEGKKTLAYAVPEVAEVHKVLGLEVLPENRPRPFKKDVLSSIKTCEIFHFAGHGFTDPNEPLQSSLLLKDWDTELLTVESLLEVNLNAHPPFLAYLSACGTSQIEDEGSVDESIHLASAFQIAGFFHVIGTLWSVDDEMCVCVARRMYEFLKENGVRDESVSRGLHCATKELRDEWISKEASIDRSLRYSRGKRNVELDDRSAPLWIPYIHYGV